MKSFECLELTTHNTKDIVIKHLRIKIDHQSGYLFSKKIVFYLIPSFHQQIAKFVAWRHTKSVHKSMCSRFVCVQKNKVLFVNLVSVIFTKIRIHVFVHNECKRLKKAQNIHPSLI